MLSVIMAMSIDRLCAATLHLRQFFLLLSTIKGRCYTNNPEMIHNLKANIALAIREMGPGTVNKLLEILTARMSFLYMRFFGPFL